MASCAHKLSGTLQFQIGDFDVAASREALRYTQRTQLAVREKIEALVDEHVAAALVELESAPTPWARRLAACRLRLFAEIPELRHLSREIAEVVEMPESAWRVRVMLRGMASKPKPRKFQGLRVTAKKRVVVRDDGRTLAGFSLQEGDVLVDAPPRCPTLPTAADAEAWLREGGCDGCPVVATSQLEWERPQRGGRSSSGNRAPAAAAYRLRDVVAHQYPYSQSWEPLGREVTAEDVVVKLDAFRCATEGTAFFDEHRRAAAALKFAGLPVPEVVGLRVPRDAVTPAVGVPHREWRRRAAAAVLAADARVRDLAEGIHLMNVTGVHGYDRDMLSVPLPAGHPVAEIIRKLAAATKSCLEEPLRRAAAFCNGEGLGAAAAAQQEFAAACARWPLLRDNLRQLWATRESAAWWAEYVKFWPECVVHPGGGCCCVGAARFREKVET